jgi:hypothetical protein
MKKATSKQQPIDFTAVNIVKNWWGEKWHIQKSNGMGISGVPDFFNSPEAAFEYARKNGIKIREIFHERA